jgi:predicted LPLAT superfamily acyltransferase
MPKWQGKSRGNKLGFQIFVFVCRTLGVRPAYFLLYFVSLYYIFFSRNTTRHIFQYFRKRHGYGVLKSYWSAYKNYYVFGQTILDKIIVLADLKNTFTYELDGVTNLKEMVTLNKGGILLSGHAGNWEIAGHMLKDLNTKVHVVMYDGEHRSIKNYLEGVKAVQSFNIIVVREDLSHVYEIGEALQKNELVCLHADRFVQDVKTLIKNFLNAPAKFPFGPFAIAATFKAPVTFVYAFKESATHYHLYSSPLIHRGSETKQEYIDFLSEGYVQSLEKMIKTYPLQWFNYYNFWEENVSE